MTTVLNLALYCTILMYSYGDESAEETTTDSETQFSSEDIAESAQNLSSNIPKLFYHLNNRQVSWVLDQKLNSYPNHKVIPDIFKKGMEVRADIEVREILDISEVDMHMKLNLLLEIHWKDPQLSFEPYLSQVSSSHGVWVGASIKDKIWTPAVSILNEKDSPTHSGGFLTESLFWATSGKLLWRINVVTTLSCSMSLQDFPMDEQECSILIGSPSYYDGEINLTVHPHMYPIFSSLVTNFELLGVRVSPIIQHIDADTTRTSFAYELLFRRYVGYYIIGTYFPSALIVIISWLTFWMPRNAAGERVALGVTCVLTTTTLLISSQASSPKVSYIKAIDVYMGVCFTLVFTTLIQSTSVGYLFRKVQIQKTAKLDGAENTGGSTDQRIRGFASVVRRVISGGVEESEMPKVTKFLFRCDAWCRAIFPILFLTFNACYWYYYLISSKYDTEEGWEKPETYANVTDGRL